MEGMEDKLNSILGNPQMMDQIMQMAKSLGASAPPQEQKPQQDLPPEPPFPGGLDPGMLQKLASITGQTGIDRDQRALLSALRPYLHPDRLRKLEKAMRSAKLAGLASQFLGSGALNLLTGR